MFTNKQTNKQNQIPQWHKASIGIWGQSLIACAICAVSDSLSAASDIHFSYENNQLSMQQVWSRLIRL